MRHATPLAINFVQAIPANLDEMTLYISMNYATAVHKCCCGCGREVVTPLSPTDWKLAFDGVSASLSPSIGNWSFECRSHYWIVENRVKWVDQWSPEQIEAGRSNDRRTKSAYFGEIGANKSSRSGQTRIGFWSQIKNWFSN
ncbi:MAG: hypothetical protein HN578_08385 [Rhodospirillales bacterium]|jgi:hypothetical protein|nr:hypothetical protein [Rhodospirillales bacterium]MBT8002921.1 hypothetical protein [Rhodospirillales bacterium]